MRCASWRERAACSVRRWRTEALDLGLRVEERLGLGDGGARGVD
jgi:hypothetical protein